MRLLNQDLRQSLTIIFQQNDSLASFFSLNSHGYLIRLYFISGMDNRPIKGNASGSYDMSFVDPTNDISAYYGGMTELQELVESYLETITYTRIGKAQLGESKVYGAKSKEQHYMDHCSVCLSNFTEGQKVKILPCKHCFHRDCVGPWFEQNNHCPNCRFQLPIKNP